MVTDPQKMASEIQRILKPGGSGYFSVLWNFDECTFFSLKNKLYVEYGMDNEEFRSIFHLGSHQALKDLFKNFKILGFDSHIQDFEIYDTLFEVRK